MKSIGTTFNHGGKQMTTQHTTKRTTPEELLANVGFDCNRKEGERDLVKEVRDIFLKHLGPEQYGRIEFFDTDPNITHAKTLTTELQRYRLLSFLNSQYSLLKGPITQHRRFIAKDMDANTLLGVIDSYHAPTMVKLGLPSTYSILGTPGVTVN